MQTPIERLKFIYNAYHVTRYHTSARVRDKQLLGQHHAGVAAIYMVLCDALCVATTIEGFRYALTHDMGEFFTGDMPAPAKRGMGLKDRFEQAEERALKEFDMDNWPTQQHLDIIKLADCIDGMLHCLWEANQGNRSALPVFWTFLSYARELPISDSHTSIRTLLFKLHDLACARDREDIFETKIGFAEIYPSNPKVARVDGIAEPERVGRAPDEAC